MIALDYEIEKRTAMDMSQDSQKSVKDDQLFDVLRALPFELRHPSEGFVESQHFDVSDVSTHRPLSEYNFDWQNSQERVGIKYSLQNFPSARAFRDERQLIASLHQDQRISGKDQVPNMALKVVKNSDVRCHHGREKVHRSHEEAKEVHSYRQIRHFEPTKEPRLQGTFLGVRREESVVVPRFLDVTSHQLLLI